MIELRYFERVVPAPEYGEGIGKRGTVLQYRQQEEKLFEEMHEFGTRFVVSTVWSEWIDVPTVKESE